MARARKMAGLSLIEAAELARYYIETSETTISRLENLERVPMGGQAKRRRQLSYVLALAYEVDPADLDLTDDDLPGGMVIAPRTPQHLRSVLTKWYGDGSQVIDLRDHANRPAVGSEPDSLRNVSAVAA